MVSLWFFFPIWSSFWQSHTIQIFLSWYFITIFINFSWNIGLNWFVCRKFVLFFHIWIVIFNWLIPVAVLIHWSSKRKRSIFHVMFLYGFIRYYWNILFVWRWYFTMSATMMLWFFTSIGIKLRSSFEVLFCWYCWRSLYF